MMLIFVTVKFMLDTQIVSCVMVEHRPGLFDGQMLKLYFSEMTVVQLSVLFTHFLAYFMASCKSICPTVDFTGGKSCIRYLELSSCLSF